MSNSTPQAQRTRTITINDREDLTRFVLFSTDISGFFPAMEIPEVAKIVAAEYLKSGLDIELDTEEMALHLAVTKTRQELVSLGLGDVTHTRIKSRGQAPVITTAEILSRGPKTKSRLV